MGLTTGPEPGVIARPEPPQELREMIDAPTQAGGTGESYGGSGTTAKPARTGKTANSFALVAQLPAENGRNQREARQITQHCPHDRYYRNRQHGGHRQR